MRSVTALTKLKRFLSTRTLREVPHEIPIRTLSDEIRLNCSRIAGQYGVSPAIGPNDFMFWFFLDHSMRAHRSEGIENYFRTGADSAISLLAEVRQYLAKSPLSMLEFASGHGRVTRHWNKIFPEAKVTACDVHERAVEFIQNDLHVDAIQSSSIPKNFDLNRTFDVVFALSFFSHMPRKTWQSWLQRLVDHVSPNGLLVFSTHGSASAREMGDPPVDKSGFWFSPASEQKDLESTEYGNTVTTFDYVFRQFRDIPNVRLLKFQEHFWAHQDNYILLKTA